MQSLGQVQVLAGFKGTKKSTPYAAQMAAENAAEKAKAFGFEKADVYVKGVGKWKRTGFERVDRSGNRNFKNCGFNSGSTQWL